MSLLKEISITELSNLRIGHTSDHDAKTGVTVLYFPNGAKAGCDISGGGPARSEERRVGKECRSRWSPYH